MLLTILANPVKGPSISYVHMEGAIDDIVRGLHGFCTVIKHIGRHAVNNQSTLTSPPVRILLGLFD